MITTGQVNARADDPGASITNVTRTTTASHLNLRPPAPKALRIISSTRFRVQTAVVAERLAVPVGHGIVTVDVVLPPSAKRVVSVKTLPDVNGVGEASAAKM